MPNLKLFLFPFAGGSKHSYRELAGHFPPSIQPIALDLPGKGSRMKEALLTEIDLMVHDLLEQMKDDLNQPYAIYGHSMGALLAHLVARKICAAGLPKPLLLFLSAFSGPAKIKKATLQWHSLPKEAFLAKVRQYGRSMGTVFQQDALLHLFEPILRADFQAVGDFVYVRQAPINVPIVVALGTQDVITLEQAKAWEQETAYPVKIYSLEGGHFFIFDSPGELIAILENELRDLGYPAQAAGMTEPVSC